MATTRTKETRQTCGFMGRDQKSRRLHQWTRSGMKSAARSRPNRLVGLVVKASASGAEDPGFESRLQRDFSGSSHTSDFKIGTPVHV